MKPIFSRNEDIDKIAFLNWRISPHSEILNILNLADGFLLAAIELATQCLENNEGKRADIIIFPILTNANHGIELYLKALTWMLNKLLNTEYKIEGSHNIKQIYQTVKCKIKAYNGQLTLKDFEEETKSLSEYITELTEKIKSTEKKDRMDFSRYPFSNKYENHFYVDEIGNVEIDLENFILRFNIIREKLEYITEHFYYDELNQE
ncbi:MAG: hypothetical protein H0V01_13895 [Bacteroidetes bacterium]|nr:hypothetical protein [Bacteroidota bacterium]HET6245386.1 hypothetical protein [Bacteroidia bacterium]